METNHYTLVWIVGYWRNQGGNEKVSGIKNNKKKGSTITTVIRTKDWLTIAKPTKKGRGDARETDRL